MRSSLVFPLTLLITILSANAEIAEKCQQPKDVGFICSEVGKQRRFYHDQVTGVCQPLFYNGCGGNENRFESAKECREECSEQPPQRMRKSQVVKPQPLMFKQLCNATYSPNLTKPLESCKNNAKCADANFSCYKGTCCPIKEHVCGLNYDSGREAVENVHEGRYAFNPKLKTCGRFSYFRAKGNFNNFQSFGASEAKVMATKTGRAAFSGHRGFNTKARGRLLDSNDALDRAEKDKQDQQKLDTQNGVTRAPKKYMRRIRSESPMKKPAPHRGFNNKAREMLLDQNKKVFCDCTRHLHDPRCPNSYQKKTLISVQNKKPPPAAARPAKVDVAASKNNNSLMFANVKAHRLLCDSGRTFSASELNTSA